MKVNPTWTINPWLYNPDSSIKGQSHQLVNKLLLLEQCCVINWTQSGELLEGRGIIRRAWFVKIIVIRATVHCKNTTIKIFNLEKIYVVTVI